MDRLASLFQRYRTRHDVAALGHVFDRAAPDLIRVALHLTRCPSLAEDAVQSTFLVAIERAETFDAGRPLMPWLVGILRNVVRQQRRKGQRLAHGEGPESVTEPTSVLDRALDELVWTDRIAEVVETFPPAWRQAFVLRYRHGLAPAEIADVTATAPATVRSHLHRGLLRLQRTLPTTCEQRPAVVLLPLLGLDGLRRAVLTRAAAGATAAPALAAPVIPGALMVKKLALAALEGLRHHGAVEVEIDRVDGHGLRQAADKLAGIFQNQIARLDVPKAVAAAGPAPAGR